MRREEDEGKEKRMRGEDEKDKERMRKGATQRVDCKQMPAEILAIEKSSTAHKIRHKSITPALPSTDNQFAATNGLTR